MSAADAQVRSNESPRLKYLRRLKELWARREIWGNLARRELTAKYKSSFLGVIWSMLHPLLYLVVFYIVFKVFLPNGMPDFPVYLLCGILPWTLFSSSIGGATESITGNAQLVSKVAFPQEMLPLATIRAQTVNFFFQLLVLAGYLVLFGFPILHRGLFLLPLALVVLLLFTAALAFATASLNVRYRDITYLVELGLLAWFWSTPIVYPAKQVATSLGEGSTGFTLYLLNPLANVVLSFQRAIYGGTSPEALAQLPAPGVRWYAIRLLILGAVSLVLLLLTWRLFYKRSGDFAEEL
jgi:ABC-2 type transport system permease protein